MSKITAEHPQRNACVYIRQSTPDQIVHNLESQRRQYGLADRAKQLGWTTVEIIDDDLGRSGGGIARPGFERLLAAICDGRVGAVLAIVVDGRKRVRRGVHRPMDEWEVLIKDHHAAYIAWDEFERNLKAIANNATGMSSALTRGARAAAGWASALRPLRPQTPCALRRQARSL
jgi:hypothetical protein